VIRVQLAHDNGVVGERGLNQIRALVVENLSLARFLPKDQRAEGSKCEIVRFSTVAISTSPSRRGAVVGSFCHTESGSHHT
jgi:hypothetical protein